MFPKFIKIVEVTNPNLMDILRRKVRLQQPYAGVFVKKNDDNADEVVKVSLISNWQFHLIFFGGNNFTIIFKKFQKQANYKIRINFIFKDPDELYPIGSFVQIIEMQDLGPKLRMVVSAHRRISLTQVLDSYAKEMTKVEGGKVKQDENLGVLVAETENLKHEPYETTDEMKALTQEIIKTIRDIIVSLYFAFLRLFPMHWWIECLNGFRCQSWNMYVYLDK